MGAKVTIDSASMMNKGFEVIEAKWLFGVDPDRIEVVVHPQSIVHSMVQFGDGSIKAQLGVPDMRLPIQYALTYPDRIHSDFGRVDFTRCHSLTFEEPDRKTFRNLDLAYRAMQKGRKCFFTRAFIFYGHVRPDRICHGERKLYGKTRIGRLCSYRSGNPDYGRRVGEC